MVEIIHEEGNFVWTYCENCLKLLGIKRWLVKAKKPNYKLSVEDGHRIFDVSQAIFYPHHHVYYEDGCEPGSWHIIPKYSGKDDKAE